MKLKKQQLIKSNRWDCSEKIVKVSKLYSTYSVALLRSHIDHRTCIWNA